MQRKRSLGLKITRTMMGVVLTLLVAVGVIVGVSVRKTTNDLITANTKIADTSGEVSMSSMTSLTQTRLKEMASAKAETANEIFEDFRQDVSTVAEAAGHLYDHADRYGRQTVPEPDAANDGNLSVQMLYADYADRDDPAFQDEAGLMGNLSDILYAINSQSESMASVYYASASGFMVQADYIAGRKFDAEGNLMPMNARERPWYAGAYMTEGPYLTPVTKDAHTDKLAIMCGVPVFAGGKIAGVAGAGIYLDDIEALVQSVELGDGGNACIINRFGQVLFSTYADGELAVAVDAPNLRASENEGLAAAASKAAAAQVGVELATINGQECYVAFAPMKTIGWSFLVVLDKRQVETPARQLVARLDQMNAGASLKAASNLKNLMMLMIGALGTAVAGALAASYVLSRRIAKPIRQLTEEVHHLEGDNLDFTWNQDTGDETQELAESFGSLTGRMKDYIRDLQTVTAEKERIGAELSIATQIQEGMLPGTFPPFPDRTDFDIFAVMDPAKEVGGDFYDFFFVDDDHLCVVMADVCGKGVPAALFMMASMIILRNNAMMGKSPAKVLEDTNNSICANNRQDMFVTVWLGILELSTGRLVAANAGHEYPTLRQPDGSYELVKDVHGFVIGGLDGEVYDEYEWQLKPGAQVFVYTDGLAEAMNGQREQFGTDRILSVLNGHAGETPKEILTQMRAAVDEFVGDAEQFDDLTMLCLDYRG